MCIFETGNYSVMIPAKLLEKEAGDQVFFPPRSQFLSSFPNVNNFALTKLIADIWGHGNVAQAHQVDQTGSPTEREDEDERWNDQRAGLHLSPDCVWCQSSCEVSSSHPSAPDGDRLGCLSLLFPQLVKIQKM